MPNGTDRINNFVARVYDPTSKSYKPIYIAPDGTDKVQGDVFLSDSTTASSLDAANGMTAASPKAVATVQANANNKLDKVVTTAQTVAGNVTFNKGLSGTLTGSLVGNASSASKLDHNVTFTVGAGATAVTATGNLSGSAVSLTGLTVNASNVVSVNKSTLPMDVIPQGALERLVKVANQTARFKLTTTNVQLGDSVLQTDTGVMYIVVDTDNLGNANGYQEYKAGTAVKATSADSATKLAAARSISLSGAVSGSASFDGTANAAIATTLGSGVVQTGNIYDAAVSPAKVSFNYAGSSSKGGAATSAVKLSTARTIALTGAATGSFSFDGSSNVSFATALSNNSVTSTQIKDGAVGVDKLATDAVVTTKIADAAVTEAKIAGGAVTEAKIAGGAVTEAKIAGGAVTTAKIHDDTVTDAKLGSTVYTVYTGSAEPGSNYNHARVWVVHDAKGNISGVKVRA